MKLLIFLIVWFLGTAVAIIGCDRIREYKSYYHPNVFLCVGIILAVGMSWILVFLSAVNGEFSLPKRKKKSTKQEDDGPDFNKMEKMHNHMTESYPDYKDSLRGDLESLEIIDEK